MLLDKYVYDNDTTWLVSRQTRYHYDYNTVNYLIPEFEYYPFEWGPSVYYKNITNQPIDYYKYQKVGDSLQNDTRMLYYYSIEYDAVNDPSDSWFKIYPNPTKGMIRIMKNKNSKIHGINLYNQLGQRVLNIDNGNYDVVDISRLNSGLYIIELVMNNNRIRDKVLIQK